MTASSTTRANSMTKSDGSLAQYDSPADRTRLHMQGTADRVLMVEGVADATVLREVLPNYAIVIAGKRENVLRAAEELLDAGQKRFVAVIDRDFEPVPEGGDWDEVLLPYEGRDLECMLVELGGLARLILFKGVDSRIAKAGGLDELVKRCKLAVEPVTHLRSHARTHGLSLAFDQVPIEGKIQAEDLAFKRVPYCMALAAASDTDLTVQDVAQIVSGATGDPGPPRGKDVVAVAAVALRKMAGDLPKAACDPAVLCSDLHGFSLLLLRESAWLGRLLQRLSAA